MTSKIVGEVNELRDEYEKHFICEDGSYIVATYTNPVHYKENGQWKEINNNLELANDAKISSKAMYTPKSGPMDIKIPQSFSNGQKIIATNKGHTISFGVKQDEKVFLQKTATLVSDVENLSSNTNKQVNNVSLTRKSITNSVPTESEITTYNKEIMVVENQASAVVYEDIFDNADLEYIVTSNSIKENIVVYEKQYDYSYSFTMDFGELIPIVNEDNSIRLVEPENTDETVFYIATPYMYDANENESTDIDMSLVKENETYILTLRANADWINSSERVFPVVIDPTVYLSYNDVFVMDGLLNKNTTKVNKELRVGRNLTNLTRTYIKPELPSNIPDGSYINDAYLILKQDNYYQALSGSDIYIRAYDCNNVASWSPDSITWNNQPFDNSDNGYKNNSGDLFLSAQQASSSKTEYSFHIINAVKQWYATGVNNGIVLVSSNESSKTQVDFHSSRADDSNNYPNMYISYTVPGITISNWETDSQAKESSYFNIVTEKAWTAYSDSDWLSLSTYSGTGYSYNQIIVDENTLVQDRIGTITVKMGNTVIGTITVAQYGADPYLTLSLTELSFDVGRNKKSVSIESNTTWSFSNLPEWITVTPSEGSMDSTVEIEVSVNNDADIRESNITVTADTVIKTINVVQLNDIEAPAKPDIYEEDGLVYISSRSFDFNEETDSPEHIEYKIENGEWTEYDGGPINIVRSYAAKVYARVRDDAENISPIAEITLENNLGEYTASYTDIALGEGLFPVEFGRTYTSTNGWFFTFDANVVKIDDNAYVFTDFYGEKKYFIKNGDDKYLSVGDEELTVNADSYVLTYGEMICTFSSDGKINRIVTDYLDTAYTWTDNLLTITGGATVTFTDGKPTKINITREGQVKEVEYIWTEDNLTKFIDAADIGHNYAYTNGLLTTNETETITYSVQGRVKLISQPNGAFVKYTYNDNATNAEVSNNVGAVTVSDSKGVTDTIYYADGVYVSNTLDGYSDNADYAPESISNALTQDSVGDVVYVAEEPEEDESADGVDAETGETETEEPEDNGISEDEAVDESVATKETTTETPLYEEIDENTYAFYTYDEQNRVIAKLEVLKSNVIDITSVTFESVKEVACTKIIYVYASSADNTITDKYVYTYTEDNKLATEKYYEADKSNILCLVYEYTYDADENVISELYYTQETENDETVDVISESYTREYSGEYMICEMYRKRIDGTLTNSKKTQYSYNDRDKLASCSTSQWLAENWYQTYSEEYTYNGYGNVISQTTTVYTNTENAETNLVETTSNITIVTYEYDPWCQQVKITKNVNGAENTITDVDYDVFGRAVSVTENDETVAYTYDGKGNILTVTEGEKLTTYTYADNGNLISRTNPNGSVASYSYDTYGNLTGHAFNGYAFTYNTLGSILTANSESGQIVNYTYSSTVDQDVLTSNFGNGQSIVYTYNDDGEITEIKFGEETKFGYEYFETTDENGEVTEKRTELTDYVNSLKKIIEENKLTVTDISDNFIYSVESVYEDEEVEDSFNGTVTTISSDVYTLVTEENKDTFKTNGTIDFTKEYTYTNDDLTQVKTAAVTTAYSYTDQLISVLENTLNDVSQTYSYVYDADGNITTETLTTSTNENGTIVETVSYVYDDDNQLISAETASIKYEYTYDDRGNILTKKEYSISLDENNQKVYTLIEANTDTYGYDETWKDKLISYNGQTITYDAVGNPTNYMGNALTWTMGRQLATFGDISYTYNESGIRTSKTSNGVTTKFYLDGTNIIEQTDGTTTLYFFYDSTGEVSGFKYNGNNYIYVKNVQGDIVAITDISGNIVTEYSYDPWGKLLSISGNTVIGELNPFRYRSYYYDRDIEMYYLQSRYYDAAIGRFINSDDVRFLGTAYTIVSYNAFSYCENNVINFIDSFGCDAIAISPLKKIYTLMASVVALMLVIEATGASATAGTAAGGPITGVLVGTGVLSLGLIGWAIYNNSIPKEETNTKTLADTTARQTKNKPYQLAYLGSDGRLVKVGKKMTLVETLTSLGIKKASNSIKRRYTMPDNFKSPDSIKSSNWGIYADSQSDAKALATVLKSTDSPKVHDSGYYGHYHDKTHQIHIWFGQPIYY